jgi:hypothetical protein
MPTCMPAAAVLVTKHRTTPSDEDAAGQPRAGYGITAPIASATPTAPRPGRGGAKWHDRAQWRPAALLHPSATATASPFLG